MRCPKCGHKTTVAETRAVVSGIRRRRHCPCGGRFMTLELIVPDRTRINDRMVLVDQRRAVEKLHELEIELNP